MKKAEEINISTSEIIQSYSLIYPKSQSQLCGIVNACSAEWGGHQTAQMPSKLVRNIASQDPQQSCAISLQPAGSTA